MSDATKCPVCSQAPKYTCLQPGCPYPLSQARWLPIGQLLKYPASQDPPAGWEIYPYLEPDQYGPWIIKVADDFQGQIEDQVLNHDTKLLQSILQRIQDQAGLATAREVWRCLASSYPELKWNTDKMELERF